MFRDKTTTSMKKFINGMNEENFNKLNFNLIWFTFELAIKNYFFQTVLKHKKNNFQNL